MGYGWFLINCIHLSLCLSLLTTFHEHSQLKKFGRPPKTGAERGGGEGGIGGGLGGGGEGGGLGGGGLGGSGGGGGDGGSCAVMNVRMFSGTASGTPSGNQFRYGVGNKQKYARGIAKSKHNRPLAIALKSWALTARSSFSVAYPRGSRTTSARAHRREMKVSSTDRDYDAIEVGLGVRRNAPDDIRNVDASCTT